MGFAGLLEFHLFQRNRRLAAFDDGLSVRSALFAPFDLRCGRADPETGDRTGRLSHKPLRSFDKTAVPRNFHAAAENQAHQ